MPDPAAHPEIDTAAPSPWVLATESALRRSGGRSTRSRRGILLALDSAPEGLSGEELLSALDAAGLNTARSTVYRTLDTLRRIGAVDTVHPAPEQHRYLPRRSLHQHHLVCESCGTVTTFDGCDLEDDLIAAASASGFQVSGHTLEIFGACRNCSPASTSADA
jgi:Fur family ferric uptake transcriptional regulator